MEIPGSSRWRLTPETECRICNKECYALFIWNYQLEKHGSQYYKHVNDTYPFELLEGFKYDHPIISINDKVQPLLPLKEFMERLDMSRK